MAGGSCVTEADRRQEYLDAYARWQRDLERLHAVLIEGEPLDPMHRIAVLRGESHSHNRYEAARRRLLGLPSGEEEGPPGADEAQRDA